jgi:hypothetical protein
MGFNSAFKGLIYLRICYKQNIFEPIEVERNRELQNEEMNKFHNEEMHNY